MFFAEQMTLQSNASVNTIGPSFQLEVDAVLDQFADDKQEEAMQVRCNKLEVFCSHTFFTIHIYSMFNYVTYDKLGHSCRDATHDYSTSHLHVLRQHGHGTVGRQYLCADTAAILAPVERLQDA